MKDQYVGDIGDFGKVLLLKHLAGLGFNVGINWMMTQNDGGPDGNHRDYVHYRGIHCLCCSDAEVLARIAPLAVKLIPQRKVGDLEALIKRFPPRTRCYKGYFDENGKREIRSREAYQRLIGSETDLVFFDPDNGLAEGLPVSAKHVYLQELQNYWKSGKSLLIYHHLPQRRLAEPVISGWTERLSEFEDCCITPFRFRRGTARVYFLCIQPDHVERARGREVADLAFTPLLFTKTQWAKLRRNQCKEEHAEWFS
jgi:hypothetical protein